MSYETYNQLSRFGFIAVIIVLQIPFVRQMLGVATGGTLYLLMRLFGVS